MQHIKISKIIDENPNVKTFYFQHNLNSKPGQFVMLWIPGIDQKPFSISSDDGETFGLTIFKRGPLTEKLFKMKVGDRVGISGPYGTSFTVDPNIHYIMVAGGYGAAPLSLLAQRTNGAKIDFLAGGRTKDNLLFEDRLSKIPNLQLHIATDDGSVGHKGYVTDLLGVILSERSESKDLSKDTFGESHNSDVDQHSNTPKDSSSPLEGLARNDTIVVTCGPELMQKKVLDICNEYDVDCEVSIERYMKCGIGICGQCAVDDLGICMCKEGPVVKRELANKIIELGKYHRDKSGAKINL